MPWIISEFPLSSRKHCSSKRGCCQKASVQERSALQPLPTSGVNPRKDFLVEFFCDCNEAPWNGTRIQGVRARRKLLERSKTSHQSQGQRVKSKADLGCRGAFFRHKSKIEGDDWSSSNPSRMQRRRRCEKPESFLTRCWHSHYCHGTCHINRNRGEKYSR